jgi:hypothetical protein
MAEIALPDLKLTPTIADIQPMRLRLIGLIALVLGLSRLAFSSQAAVAPAPSVAHHRAPVWQRAVQPAGQLRASKRSRFARSRRVVRPRSQWHAPIRRQPSSTPVIPAPTIGLAALGSPATPRLIRQMMYGMLEPKPTLRSHYWTAERTGAAVFAQSSPVQIVAAHGDPRFAGQPLPVVARLSIRL